MSFAITQKNNSSLARTGKLTTVHGEITTPVFMPVGTRGCVKTISPRELEEINIEIILGNTYHLKVRPGPEIIQDAGGIQALEEPGKCPWDGVGFSRTCTDNRWLVQTRSWRITLTASIGSVPLA